MRYLTALAAAAVVLLAACGSASPGTTAGGSSPGARAASASPVSCRAQYLAWRNGPARTAARKLEADLHALQAAANAEDIKQLQAALVRAGHDAKPVEAYPAPRCADPHGYWHQILTGLQAAADNASTGSGLGALLLAMGPLQKVKAAEKKLSAELKQTVHASL
jgi:hypothetical protein